MLNSLVTTLWSWPFCSTKSLQLLGQLFPNNPKASVNIYISLSLHSLYTYYLVISFPWHFLYWLVRRNWTLTLSPKNLNNTVISACSLNESLTLAQWFSVYGNNETKILSLTGYHTLRICNNGQSSHQLMNLFLSTAALNWMSLDALIAVNQLSLICPKSGNTAMLKPPVPW